MNRIDILRASLEKKARAFDEALSRHLEDVRSANGQPLNDKRNGAQTMQRWDKQRDALRRMEASIERTKRAIEIEENKIANCELVRDGLPSAILATLQTGDLRQWRKHPNTFFVDGVDKARIVWDEKRQLVFHRYTKTITDPDQWRKFATTFNAILRALKEAA